MKATYKVTNADGTKNHAVAQPTPSAAMRAAKIWADTLHADMLVINEQTGEVRFTVAASN